MGTCVCVFTYDTVTCTLISLHLNIFPELYAMYPNAIPIFDKFKDFINCYLDIFLLDFSKSCKGEEIMEGHDHPCSEGTWYIEEVNSFV